MKNFSLRKAGGVVCLFSSAVCGVLPQATYANHGFAPWGARPLQQQQIQQQMVSGVVSDSGGVLPGVTVSVKGRANRDVVTDADGRFSIAASSGEVLAFSFIGYRTQELTVSPSVNLKILMTTDAMSLQEVTVNAGYYSVKERERTGSIAKITAKDIETQPVTNILAAMQGRMAGVNIIQTSGTPGAGFEVQIRGINSLRPNANQPLYVIDGVPYSSEPMGTGVNSNVLPTQPSPLTNINPDQIESIEVLKDADATAIYGSRGANGVVLITTKKGKAGKTRFTANVSSGAGRITNRIDQMGTREYLAMRNQAFANDGLDPADSFDPDVNGTWSSTRYTNWQKELLGGTAAYSDARLSLSGGNERTQFLASAAFTTQGTVMPRDFAYKKGNVHLNVNHTSANNKFKSVFTAGYTVQDNNQPRADLTLPALQLAPNAPALLNPDGTINWEGSTFNNPLSNLVGGYRARTYDLVSSALLSYKLLDHLELRSNFGFTNLTHHEDTPNLSTAQDPAWGYTSQQSSVTVSRNDRRSWIIEPQLNYVRGFGKAKLDVLLGTTFQSQDGSQTSIFARSFPSNSMVGNLAAAGTLLVISDSDAQYRYTAAFGRVNLDWDGKYIVNLTGRRDGSSRFGPGKRFSNFGAVGAAWLFSEEKPFENSILSLGKLRASYGITGSDNIGDYQYLNTYSASGTAYNGVGAIEPSRLFNPNFGWESNRKLEAAIELGFFRDRISLSAAAYRNRSSNQLIGIPLPGTTGFNSLTANLDATVENRGYEFTLRTVNFDRKDFNWTTSLNLALSRNELIDFPGLAGSTYTNQYIIGQSLNIQKVYKYTGIDPETGVYTFEDFDGDGNISSDKDKQSIQDFTPDYFGGLHNQLRYKRVELSFLFQFVKQRNFNERAFFSVPGIAYNQPPGATFWQQPGDNAQYQVLTTGANSAAVDAYFKYAESDAVIGDASYIRLKNIALSYDLPDGIFKDMKCRVYAQAQNLFTITSYKGFDPEFRQLGYLPPMKMITAGIQLSL